MNLLGSVNSEIHKKSGEYHKFLFKPFQFYMYDNEITYPMIASWWVSWVSACDSSSRGSCWISGCRRFQTLTGCAIVVPTVSRGGVVGLTAVTSIPTLNSDECNLFFTKFVSSLRQRITYTVLVIVFVVTISITNPLVAALATYLPDS